MMAAKAPGSSRDVSPARWTIRRRCTTSTRHWLGCSDRDPSRPYFLRLSFNAPHTPVVTPAPFDTLIDAWTASTCRWTGRRIWTSPPPRTGIISCDYAGTHRLTEAQIRRARQCYYGYVACVDHVFGKLLDALDAMGELENTIIAFVADHGTHLGDHGFFQKQSFWDASARVPLFFAGPGIREQIMDTPVNAGSLLPTLLDLAGLDVPPQVQFPTLAATVTGEDPPLSPQSSAKSTMASGTIAPGTAT